MSARDYDINGWFEVQDNPLSLVGVYPYLGSSIGAPDPEKIYNVLRPAEELSDPETLASFRLMPWTDEHAMLGEDFKKDAEDRPVSGVIGENVWFDPTLGEYGGMRGNLKCFSEAAAKRLDAGKDELSVGYRCVYDFTPGEFNGKPYDAIQRTMRGNHVASVLAGRMGSLVAVLDHMTFTTDGMEFQPVKKKLTDADLKRINASPRALAAVLAAMDAEEKTADKAEDEEAGDIPGAEDEDDDKSAKDEGAEKKAEDEDDDKSAKDEGEKAEDEDDDDDKKAEDEDDDKSAKDDDKSAKDDKIGMDEATFVSRLAVRDKLAKGLRPIIGTFDHAGMTLEATAAYGVKKLGLRNVPKGHEQTAISAYLAGRSSAPKAPLSSGMDGKEGPAKRTSFIERVVGK